MCRDHRHPTACQKQYRQNEPGGQEEITLGWSSVSWGILDMSRDHRYPTACQKQHRQNEPVGLVDIATGAEVCVMMDLGDMKGPQMSHNLSKTTHTE